MADEKTAHFKIIVRGQLDAHWQHWFEEVDITHPHIDQTQFEGQVIDEAAFDGLLSKIRALGLSILFVERKDHQNDVEN
jgi:hypothetical protein